MLAPANATGLDVVPVHMVRSTMIVRMPVAMGSASMMLSTAALRFAAYARAKVPADQRAVSGFALKRRTANRGLSVHNTWRGRSVTKAVRRTLEAGWEVFIDENGGGWPGCAAAQAATNKRLATSWAWCGKGQPLVTD